MTGQQASGRGATARGPSSGEAEAEAEAKSDGEGALIQLRRRLGHAELTAVPEVRHALRELLLRNRKNQSSTDVAELLTTELVTNALVHTEHDAEVTATVAASRLRVEVRDFVARHPQPHTPPADDGTHGRGLILVQALADAWGVRAQGVGKVVWFELDMGGGGPA
ncbi:ATP-binding protein [Streptomyces sp. ISL-100]|uniref:ATP-binding protein n=1 Tax=Streptomyces sp. ISL-100 TaxID=2819173 RepID=UPI001BE69E3A|nr:ATP-binding protein [Streptomyces sp. ISL-100]MBT2399486.1 ATP-binding protein [Streptomyces sp. ISL-100]